MNSFEKVKGGGWVEKRRKNLARNVRHFYITELRENAFLLHSYSPPAAETVIYIQFGRNFSGFFSVLAILHCGVDMSIEV